MHRHCVQPHYEECHPGRDCPEEFRFLTGPRAWLPYADSTLTPKAEQCWVHANRCTTRSCPWRHLAESKRCECETPREVSTRACEAFGTEMCPNCDLSEVMLCWKCININPMLRLPHVATSRSSPSCTSHMEEQPMQCGCTCKCTKRARGSHVCGKCEASVCDGKCFREGANVCHMCLP